VVAVVCRVVGFNSVVVHQDPAAVLSRSRKATRQSREARRGADKISGRPDRPPPRAPSAAEEKRHGRICTPRRRARGEGVRKELHHHLQTPANHGIRLRQWCQNRPLSPLYPRDWEMLWDLDFASELASYFRPAPGLRQAIVYRALTQSTCKYDHARSLRAMCLTS
jgi:hypothetical protein